MQPFVRTSFLTAVIPAAQQLLEHIHSGELVDADGAAAGPLTTAADRLQAAVDAANDALNPRPSDSPFLRHRRVILDGYSTAERLAELVLHLWNPHYPVRLGVLLGNADERHRGIAFELIASYALHGENDPHFMNLADEIRERKAIAAQAA